MSNQKAAFESKLEGGDQRAAFEVWCQERFGRTPLWDHENNKYLLSSAQMRFEAYQAALASPEVQALREDAERYRYWRVRRFNFVKDDGITLLISQDLDAAIDAARGK